MALSSLFFPPAMASGLQDSVRAAEGLMVSLSGGHLHEEASRMQAAALAQAVGAAVTVSVADRAALCTEINRMHWHNTEHRDIVLKALMSGGAAAAAEAPGAKPTQRRGNQDWTKCDNYLPQSVWDVLASSSVVSTVKADVLQTFFLRMGLRNPCEHTSKNIATIALISVEGVRQAAQSRPEVRHAYVQKWKSDFKRRAHKAPNPAHYLEVLPADPQTLHTNFPLIWQAAYGDADPPVACKFTGMDISSVSTGFGCRKTHACLTGKGELQIAGKPSNDLTGALLEVVSKLLPRQDDCPGLQVFDGRSSAHLKRLPSNQRLPSNASVRWEASPTLPPALENAGASDTMPKAEAVSDGLSKWASEGKGEKRPATESLKEILVALDDRDKEKKAAKKTAAAAVPAAASKDDANTEDDGPSHEDASSTALAKARPTDKMMWTIVKEQRASPHHQDGQDGGGGQARQGEDVRHGGQSFYVFGAPDGEAA